MKHTEVSSVPFSARVQVQAGVQTPFKKKKKTFVRVLAFSLLFSLVLEFLCFPVSFLRGLFFFLSFRCQGPFPSLFILCLNAHTDSGGHRLFFPTTCAGPCRRLLAVTCQKPREKSGASELRAPASKCTQANHMLVTKVSVLPFSR